MTKNETGVATGMSNSPVVILVEVSVPALDPEWVVYVEKMLGNGYRLGEWRRDRSCVAVGYEVFTVRRMRVVKSDAHKEVVPEGCRAATPYELAMYVQQNPDLHGCKGMGCFGEVQPERDGLERYDYRLMYDGVKREYDRVMFHMAGFPLGTAILYVEL